MLKEENEYINSRKITEKLVWILIEMCGPQNDENVKLRSGECLSELGTVYPFANMSFHSLSNSPFNKNYYYFDIINPRVKFLSAKVNFIKVIIIFNFNNLLINSRFQY